MTQAVKPQTRYYQLKQSDTSRKLVRGLPAIAPTKHNLHSLIISARHLFSCILHLRDQMPRGQKNLSGICAPIIQHADRALFLTTLISDYASRHNREDLLRELSIVLKHLKELVITAFERGYITKRSTLDQIATKIIEISDNAVSYAKWLENKKQSGDSK
jgi:hypothetical protein